MLEMGSNTALAGFWGVIFILVSHFAGRDHKKNGRHH